ncbi:MAG: DUF2867 domain-containing protein [Pseudomonas sp.]|nr:DUF2867 domain-containing protein [Pseudomonas sp.]
MKTIVSKCTVPALSSVNQYVQGADFVDCQSARVVDVQRTALGHALTIMAATPAWIDSLMKLRNRAVKLVGLKDLGGLKRIDLKRDEASYQPGQRIGIFTLVSSTDDEALMVDRDKHLDVYVVLNRLPIDADGSRTVVLSTVVRTHNLLGKVYMVPVGPMHRVIAPRTLANING